MAQISMPIKPRLLRLLTGYLQFLAMYEVVSTDQRHSTGLRCLPGGLCFQAVDRYGALPWGCQLERFCQEYFQIRLVPWHNSLGLSFSTIHCDSEILSPRLSRTSADSLDILTKQEFEAGAYNPFLTTTTSLLPAAIHFHFSHFSARLVGNNIKS